jgi:hypothetical protein
MDPRVGLDVSEKRKRLLPLGIESRMSSLKPVAIPTIHTWREEVVA